LEIQIFPYQESEGPSLHILGILEEERTIQAVWVEGPNLYLHIDAFQDGKAFFGAGRIPSPLPEGDFYRLNLRFSDQTHQFPLVGLGGLLFPKGGLRLESKVTERTQLTVQPGDWLYQIAREHDTTVALIQWINEIDDRIVPGQVLRIGDVAFDSSPLELRILLGRCLLQVVYQDQVIREYPVAVGRGTSTPIGTFHIARKVPEPMLYWQGQALQPLSPINGLGIWWLELNNPQYGIHGTTRPWEIGKRISHGCIRMFDRDIDHLQTILAVGTPVHIRP
jgi:LysM repeat protein